MSDTFRDSIKQAGTAPIAAIIVFRAFSSKLMPNLITACHHCDFKLRPDPIREMKTSLTPLAYRQDRFESCTREAFSFHS